MKRLSLYLIAILFIGCADAQNKKGDHDFAALPQPKAGEAVATFGGGCFWAMGEALSELKGVNKVVAGYAGGKTKNPTYEEVCTRTTNHAETVQVYYDPK
jgi:peptide-methionine (S)-S-oxide reductase